MKTVSELVRSLESRSGTAIVDKHDLRTFRYSYAEFALLVRKMAGLLKSRGVKVTDRVMLWAPNSAESVATVLATMACGAVIVPIDVRQTTAFFEKVRDQVKPKVIVHSRIRPVAGNETVHIENIHWLVSEHDPVEFKDFAPDTLAELLYTSGTTGDPKGVMLTHDNLMQDVTATLKIQHINRHSRFLSLLPLSHVFEQVVNLFIPLHQGATIVYLSSIKSSSIFQAFNDDWITHCAVVPRILELFRSGIENRLGAKRYATLVDRPKSLKARLIAGAVRRRFGRVRQFLCGGAPLDTNLELFFDNLGVPVIQGYGLTETTAILASNSYKRRKIGAVGVPLDGVHVRIAKDGEILVKGRTVTKGYYEDEEATKAAIKKGWLHTGDLGMADKDGFLHLNGRKKDMIVTSAGVNVYPGDVEAVLRTTSGVKDAVVLGVKRGRKEVVHAVLLLERKASARKVIDTANKKLDSAQAIVEHTVWKGSDFPRTPTMKVKRFELLQHVKAKKHTVTRSTGRVQRILSSFTTKKITAGMTLVQLGLSSVDRVDLINRLEQEYGVDFDDNMLAGDMKVKQLEEYVTNRRVADKREVTKKWTLFWPVRWFRLLMQELALLPINRFFGSPRVRGIENLDAVSGPVFFIANHQSHLDVTVIMIALPWRFKKKLAIGVWQQFFFDINRRFHSRVARLNYYMTTLFWNGFAFSQRKWFRRSARYAGKLIDDGWNIMLFPEGKRTTTGKIGTFRGAIGLFGKEMRVPVVPIRIDKVNDQLPIGKFWPRFMRPTVVFGEPIRITSESPLVATKRIETVVRSLL